MAIGVCQGCKLVKDIEYTKELLCRKCYDHKRYEDNERINKPIKKQKIDAFTRSSLEQIIKLSKESHSWMLKDIKHRADEFDVEYSDELNHAIGVQQLLDMM